MSARVGAAQVYRGKVSNVMDFGAFVELQGMRQRAEGLVHVSEISKMRANSAREVLNRGQECWVKVMRISTAGGKQQLSLSMRDVDQAHPPPPPQPSPARPVLARHSNTCRRWPHFHGASGNLQQAQQPSQIASAAPVGSCAGAGRPFGSCMHSGACMPCHSFRYVTASRGFHGVRTQRPWQPTQRLRASRPPPEQLERCWCSHCTVCRHANPLHSGFTTAVWHHAALQKYTPPQQCRFHTARDRETFGLSSFQRS